MVVLLCNIFREYCCASAQYFLHNHAHRCFQSSHAQCSSWPTSCATSTSRRRQGLACDPALAQCPPWSAAWRVEFFIIWREFDVRDYFWKKTAASCQICRGWWRKAIVMFFLKNTSPSILSHVKYLKNLSRCSIGWLRNLSIPNIKLT